MANRIVKVVIMGDSNSLKRAMSSSEQSLQNLDKTAAKAQGSISGMEKAMGTAMKVTAVVAGGAAVTGALKSVIDAASNSEQAFGALDTVFKGQSAAMRGYADDSIQMGLSHGEYAKQAALLGSLLKNLGTAQSDLVPTTRDLITHATDLKSTYGGTTADAVSALGAAFKGQFNPMERYGAALRAADVTALQAAEGISKSEAIIRLVMEQTADAVGQAERETDTFAATQERATAAADSAKVALGQGLLPVFSKLASVAEGAATAFGAIPKPLLTWATNIGLVVAAYKLLKLGAVKTAAALGTKAAATAAEAAATKAAATANHQYVLSMAEVRASSKAAAFGAVSSNIGKIAKVAGAAGIAVGVFAYAMGKAAESGAAAAVSADDYFAALERGEDIARRQIETGGADWWVAQRDGIYDLQEAFDTIDTSAWEGWTSGAGDFISTGAQLTEELRNRADALTRLAEVDPSTAREGLLELQAAADAAGIGAEDLENIIPGLAAAIEGVGPKADAASDGLATLNASYDAAKDAASGFKRAMAALFTGLNVEEETDEWIVALGKLDEALKPGGIKGNTEAALANRAALRDTATEAKEVTVAQIEHGDSLKTVMKSYWGQRKALVETMVQSGISRKEARKYTKELLGTPEEVKTAYKSNAPEKEEDAASYNRELDRTPGYIRTDYEIFKTISERYIIGYDRGSGGGSSSDDESTAQDSLTPGGNTTVILDGYRVASVIAERTSIQHREVWV